MTDQPITWAEVRDAVAALHEGLAGAHDQARDNMMSPRTDVLANTEYRAAFADLQWEVDGLRARAERLVERMAESPAPARPLEAVLPAIEAEGHEYEVHSPGWADRTGHTVGSRRRGVRYQSDADAPLDERIAAHERYTAEGEVGEIVGDDVVVADEGRLAQIRKLHAEKLAKDGLAANEGARRWHAEHVHPGQVVEWGANGCLLCWPAEREEGNPTAGRAVAAEDARRVAEASEEGEASE